MPEQQIEEGRDYTTAQPAVADKNPDPETTRRPRGYSCYSVELLKLLEE